MLRSSGGSSVRVYYSIYSLSSRTKEEAEEEDDNILIH